MSGTHSAGDHAHDHAPVSPDAKPGYYDIMETAVRLDHFRDMRDAGR